MTEASEALRHALCTTCATIERHESRAWASLTFSGERHRLDLRFAGEDAAAEADRFLDGFAEREFALEGHVLADIVLVADQRDGQAVRLTLEALTVKAD